MGRTSKPLRIVVLPPVTNWPEVAALEAQKHDVFRVEPGCDHLLIRDVLLQADVILGPTAHRMSEDEHKWLPAALAEARRRRYGMKTADTSPEKTDDL